MKKLILLCAALLISSCASSETQVRAQPYREIFILVPDDMIPEPLVINDIIGKLNNELPGITVERLTIPEEGVMIRIDAGRARIYGLVPETVLEAIAGACGINDDQLVSRQNTYIMAPTRAINRRFSGGQEELMRLTMTGSDIPLSGIATVQHVLIRRSVVWNSRSWQMIRIGFNPLMRPAVSERIRSFGFFKTLGCEISDTEVESVTRTPQPR